MLSRVADQLYWMSRYLERAEHTARLLDVNLSQMLDQTPAAAERRWDRLLASLSQRADGRDAFALAHTLTLDATNPASIVSAIGNARDNARQIREQISSEMWLQLNRLYHRVNEVEVDAIWQNEPYEFYQGVVKDGIHLFQGITDATLNHGEGWHFIRAGRYLERALNTTLLLDTHFAQETTDERDTNLTYLEWVDLLKSCTSFEAYCKVYTVTVRREWILEFLLLNAESPRSLRFCADRLRDSIDAIILATGRGGERARRLAGRLQASLDYAQVDEILSEGLPLHLSQSRRQCELIHETIVKTYLNPVVTTPLA